MLRKVGPSLVATVWLALLLLGVAFAIATVLSVVPMVVAVQAYLDELGVRYGSSGKRKP